MGWFSWLGDLFSSPQQASPPPPPNSVTYGDYGDVLSRQVYDPATNTWITTGRNAEPQKPALSWVTGLTGDYNKDMQNPDVKAEVERRFQLHVQADPKGIKNHSGAWRGEAYSGMMGERPTALAQYEKDLADYNTKYDAWKADNEARKIEQDKIAGIRSQAISNLNELSPERQAQIAEFGKSFSDSMHSELDPKFAEMGRQSDESMNSKGMFGSRAYVDLKSELAADKMRTDTDIANQAAMAKETLLNNDRNYWAGLLDSINSGQRSDILLQANLNKANSDAANQNYAGTLAYNQALNNNTLNNWNTKTKLASSLLSSGSGLAGGLLYLYGQGQGGNNSRTTATRS